MINRNVADAEMFPQVLKKDFVEKHTNIDQFIEASTYLRRTASKNNPKTNQSVPVSLLLLPLFVILSLVCLYTLEEGQSTSLLFG